MHKLLFAILAIIAASHAWAGSYEDLVSKAREEENVAASKRDERTTDGRLTVEAARRSLQGRSDYDQLVYAFAVSARIDEVDWTPAALKAAKQQIDECRYSKSRHARVRTQVQAQIAELSGDWKDVNAQEGSLRIREIDAASKTAYACRGIPQVTPAYEKAAAKTDERDPLFDR